MTSARDEPARGRRSDAGDDATRSFRLARDLFIRGLGLVHGMAFLSLWSQMDGLCGRAGIMPAAALMERVRSSTSVSGPWDFPTLCWLSSSDGMLHALCASGVVAAMLLMAGIAPIPVLALLWSAYLSLSLVCQPFLGFQWDTLLLETTFTALFIAPLTLVMRPFGTRPPPAIGLMVVRLLLFKLMFLSGITKLLSGDPTWRDLTALQHHYETQPLPTWLGWHAHHLPDWFGALSVLCMYVIEIAVPFLILAPWRPLRRVAALAMILLQLLIGATGNYGFFNLLAIVLCIPLLDDALLLRLVPRRWRSGLDSAPGPPARRWWRHWPLLAAAPLILASMLTMVAEMHRTQRPGQQPWIVTTTLDKADRWLLSWGEPSILAPVRPYRTINGYGLFRVMTTSRPEIVIEGSDDGRTWKEYGFTWKAGDLRRRPAFVAPHMPRLDWQMWFAALNPPGNAYWLEPLMQRLLDGTPEVLELLESDPFPDRPPRYLRLVYHDYAFTDRPTRRATGAWWHRELRGATAPVSSPAPRSSTTTGGAT